MLELPEPKFELVANCELLAGCSVQSVSGERRMKFVREPSGSRSGDGLDGKSILSPTLSFH